MGSELTFDSIIDLFGGGGGGSTKVTSQIIGKEELQKIQTDAKNQKIIVDGLINNNIPKNPPGSPKNPPGSPKNPPGSPKKTLTAIQVTDAAKFAGNLIITLENEGKAKNIAKLTAENENIENKSSDIDAEEKSKNIDELAKNSEEIDSLLGNLQETNEEKYAAKETALFVKSLTAFRQGIEDEREYRGKCRKGVQDALSDTLKRCSLTKTDVDLYFQGLPDQSSEELKANFDIECLQMAASSISQFTDSWLPDLKLLTESPMDRVKDKEN